MKKILAILLTMCLLLCPISAFAEPAEAPEEEPLSVTLDVLNRGADLKELTAEG